MARAGDLRERIAFEKREAGDDDGYGNTEAQWKVQFIVWAALEPRFGGEGVQAARLAGTQPWKMTVRSSSNTRRIVPEWRARHERDGTIYNIRTPQVNPDLKDNYIELLVETGVASG